MGSVKGNSHMDNILKSIKVIDNKKYPKLYMRTATLYYLRLEFNTIAGNGNNSNMAKSPLVLYKLGYTCTSLNERIFGKLPSYSYKIISGKRKYIRSAGHKGMELPAPTKVYEVSTYSHRNASYIYQVEQELHYRYRQYQYTGAKVMGNGNTELYTIDILGLDN